MAGQIIGSFPPTGGVQSEAGIAATADAAATAPVGAIYSVFDRSTNNWSLIAYYQAGATVVKGDALGHDTSQRATYRCYQNSVTNFGQVPRGFAAANVSNTGYYSWRYVAGYCPTIKFLSNVASNQVCVAAASIVGAMSSYPAGASISSTATTAIACVYSLDVNAATAVNSGIIQGFML